MMINKNRFRVSNDKKVLHKIGKRWVTVSALTLALLGGAAAASTVTTHADTTPAVEAQHTNSVKKQINSNLNSAANSNSAKSTTESAQSDNATKPSAVQSQANHVYRGLMMNAANQKPSAKSAGSSVASNAPIHQSAQPNSAYEAYLKQNPQLAQDYYGNATPSASSKVASNAPKDNVSASSIASNSSASSVSANNSKVSSANQISDKKNKPLMKVAMLGGTQLQDTNIVAHGNWGTAKWELSNAGNLNIHDGTIDNSYENGGNAQGGFVYNAKNLNTNTLNAIKTITTSNLYMPKNGDLGELFSNFPNVIDIDLSGIHTEPFTNFNNMISHNPKLERIDNLSVLARGSSTVSDFDGAFYMNPSLQSVDLSGFKTAQSPNFNGVFSNDYSLKTVNLGGNFTIKPNTDTRGIFNNDGNINHLILNNNIKLTNTGNNPYQYGYNNQNGDIRYLFDGNSHAGDWTLINTQNPSNWKSGNDKPSAFWVLDKLGGLHVSNGTISRNLYDAQNLDWSKVKKVYFMSVSINDGSNSQEFNDELNELLNDKRNDDNNLTNINTINPENNTWSDVGKVNNDKEIVNNADDVVNGYYHNLTDSDIDEANADASAANSAAEDADVENLVASLDAKDSSANATVSYNDSVSASSAETAASNSANNAVANAERTINSDINKINNMTNSNTTLNSLLNSAKTTIDNDSAAINSWKASSQAIATSLASASSSNNANSSSISSLETASTTASQALDRANASLASDATSIGSLKNALASVSSSASNGSAQATSNSGWIHNNSGSLSNASTEASEASAGASTNAGAINGIKNELSNYNTVSADAISAMSSLNADKTELSWLANSESALSTGSSQASSNAGWIANNSASVSALSGKWTSVNAQISNDSKALNDAINAKADNASLTADYSKLSNDISTASGLANTANQLADTNSGEISNLKANTAITFTFTKDGQQYHSPVTLTNSYIEDNAQPTGNTRPGQPGTYNVNNVLNVSAPEGYSVDGQYTVTIGKDSNGIANIKFGTVGAMAPTKPRRHFGMMLLSAMPRLFGASEPTAPKYDTNSNDVKLIGNEAEYSGTITLKFGDKTTTIHYDTGKNNQNVRTGDTINLLQYADTKANTPTDYIGDKLINGFDTTGFSFAQNGSDPYNITVQPSDAKTGTEDSSQSNPKNITLNYSAQTVTDKINYNYNGKSEGTDTTAGTDDAQATWTTNNVKGLKPGWKLANPTNNFNIVKGTTNIDVVPIKRTDTINYIDQKGDNVGTQTFTGNDKNATDASDNSIDVNSSNTKLDSDYSLDSKDNTFNYDGGTYTVNVTGKARSTKNPIKPDNNSDPTDAKNDKSNKNMPTPPKSDDSVLFTIHVNDYTADGKLIGSHTKYATETGKFGDHFTINAADYQTYGFNIKSGTDKSVTGVIGDNQLNPNNATFDYYAKQYNPADAAKHANDPTYPKPITVQYIGEKNGRAGQVIESQQITGDTGTTGNVEKQVPVPQGYTADSNPSYTITTQAQTIKINLTSVSHKHKTGTKSPSDTTNPDNPANPTNSQNPTNPSNPNGTTNPNNPNSPLNKGNKHHQDTTGTKGQTNPWNPSSSNSPYNPKNPDSPFNPNSPLNPNKTGGNDDPTNPNSPLDPQNPNSPLNQKNPNSPLSPKNNSYEPNHPENDPWNPNNPDSPLSPTNPISPYNPNNPDSPLDSKGNQAEYNAKNGIATVIVTKFINGKLIGGYSSTVNEDDMATGEQRTIAAPTVNGYNVTGANGFTVTMNGDGSLTNGAHTFVYVVDASKIAPISITFRNQNGDYVDKSTGNLTNDSSAATITIPSEELATLGAVGDYVNITNAKELKAPEGYSFADSTRATVENNSNKLNNIQLVAPKVSLDNPLGAIHLSLMADVPEPKPAPKPTPTSNVIPSAASSEANSAASSAAQSASTSASASAASAEQSAVNSAANSAAQNNGSAVTSTEQSMAKADASNEAHDDAVASAARSAAGSAEASAAVSAADEVRSAEANHNDSKAVASVKASAASAERSAAKSAAQSAKASATDSVEDSIASSEDNQEAHASQNSEAPSEPVEHGSQMIGNHNAEPSHEANVQREAASHMVGVSNKLAQPSTTVHASRVGSNDQNANGHKLPQTNEDKAAGLMGAASIMAALGLAGTDTDRKRRRE